MSAHEEFDSLIEQLDDLLERYEPSDEEEERIRQRPLLEEVIELATRGLERFPFNSELLRRRAYARCRVVDDEGEHVDLEHAEGDLHTILHFDPENLYASYDLLEDMFVFSVKDEEEVAEIAEEFASRAEKLLLDFVVLRARAVAYAGKMDEARALLEKWISLFPDSEALTALAGEMEGADIE